MKFSILTLCLSLLMGGERTAFTGDRFAVAVKVIVDNASIRSELESYLKRELRGLNDIDIVETNQTYSVIVLAAVPDGGKRPVALAISASFYSHWRAAALESVFKNYFPELNEIRRSVLSGMFQASVIQEGHTVDLSTYPNMRATCQSIVTVFDTTVLEPQRKIFKSIEDSFKSKTPQSPDLDKATK